MDVGTPRFDGIGPLTNVLVAVDDDVYGKLIKERATNCQRPTAIFDR
jgi:hypothetical protein